MLFCKTKLAKTKLPKTIPTIVLATLLATGASRAGAEERCSGTLCDFYYGNSNATEAPATKPAAKTPLTVPSLFSIGSNAQAGAPASNGVTTSGATSAPTSRVQVKGGGLLSLARGQPTERCTGTLCDAFYGGSPPEKPETPAATTTQPLPDEAVAAAEPNEAPPTSRRRRDYETVEREMKPRCAATAQDPWRCYR